MENKVNLVHVEGETATYIDVEITPKGDLLFSGQDVGKAPQEFFGDLDYEYWLTIEARHKDQVLLALIEKFYSGNPQVTSELMEYLKSKGIPFKFSSY